MTFLRPIFAIISLLILVAAVYLLWTWYRGEIVTVPDGRAGFHRDAWRLWSGAPLMAWSFLGRPLFLLLLARKDAQPVNWDRGQGEMIEGANGETLNVREIGPKEAPVILLTHGWSLDHSVWHYATIFRGISGSSPGTCLALAALRRRTSASMRLPRA